MHNMGKAFAPPRSSDIRAWREIERHHAATHLEVGMSPDPEVDAGALAREGNHGSNLAEPDVPDLAESGWDPVLWYGRPRRSSGR
jgi:hypothetical protein